MDDLNLGTDNTQQQAPVTPQQETPESLHARAMTHLHNARDLYLKQLQTQAPTPEHHKMGLGIMAAALAAAALDPTQNKSGNNAGTAFYNHYKAAQQQRDEEQNQRNQSRYQHQGQIAMARSGFETEDAARLLQDKKDLEDEAEQDRKDKRQDKVDEFNQAMKKAALDGQNHRAEIGQKAKDIEGWRKLMGSQIPAARVIGAHGLKAEIEKDRPGVQEAGYNPTDLEKSIEDSFKTISNPTPKDQAAIDLSGARKAVRLEEEMLAEVNAMYPDLPADAKAEIRNRIGSYRTYEDLQAAKANKVHELLANAKAGELLRQGKYIPASLKKLTKAEPVNTERPRAASPRKKAEIDEYNAILKQFGVQIDEADLKGRK